jgi:hypothetical protein
MLIKSTLIAEGSGSLAGAVWSHNRGGQYLRQRVVPTDPATERQITLRNAMSTLSNYWTDILTPTLRETWNLYASNVVMHNALGDPIYLTGQQHFLRANLPRIQASIVIIATAPAIFDLGTYSMPSINEISAGTATIKIAFSNTDGWCGQDGFGLVYAGRPQNPSIGFFKGPFRYAGKIVGAVVPPTSPQTFPFPFPLAITQIAWAHLRIIQTDGRLSPKIILGPETIIL